MNQNEYLADPSRRFTQQQSMPYGQYNNAEEEKSWGDFFKKVGLAFSLCMAIIAIGFLIGWITTPSKEVKPNQPNRPPHATPYNEESVYYQESSYSFSDY